MGGLERRRSIESDPCRSMTTKITTKKVSIVRRNRATARIDINPKSAVDTKMIEVVKAIQEVVARVFLRIRVPIGTRKKGTGMKRNTRRKRRTVQKTTKRRKNVSEAKIASG